MHRKRATVSCPEASPEVNQEAPGMRSSTHPNSTTGVFRFRWAQAHHARKNKASLICGNNHDINHGTHWVTGLPTEFRTLRTDKPLRKMTEQHTG